MADLVINGKNYNGVSSVKIPNSGGTQETFIQPSGDKNISANGTVDVSAFARAVVNVPTSVSGTKQINANGTYDIAAFAQAVVNVPTSGGLTNISTGTVNPVSVTELDIPVDASKGDPIIIMAWSDDAYNAGVNRTCGYVSIVGVYDGVTSTADKAHNYRCLYYDTAKGLSVKNLNGNRNASGAFVYDRPDIPHGLSTADTFHYIVFYKPIGDLSFGGASA